MALFITCTDAAATDKDKTAVSGSNSNSEGKSSTAELKGTKTKQSSSIDSTIEPDKSPLSNNSADSAASTADPRSAPKIFSKRAMECSVGSIHDFVAVLLSPGREDPGP